MRHQVALRANEPVRIRCYRLLRCVVPAPATAAAMQRWRFETTIDI